jgi:hypothetical protein
VLPCCFLATREAPPGARRVRQMLPRTDRSPALARGCPLCTSGLSSSLIVIVNVQPLIVALKGAISSPWPTTLPPPWASSAALRLHPCGALLSAAAPNESYASHPRQESKTQQVGGTQRCSRFWLMLQQISKLNIVDACRAGTSDAPKGEE